MVFSGIQPPPRLPFCIIPRFKSPPNLAPPPNPYQKYFYPPLLVFIFSPFSLCYFGDISSPFCFSRFKFSTGSFLHNPFFGPSFPSFCFVVVLSLFCGGGSFFSFSFLSLQWWWRPPPYCFPPYKFPYSA